MPLEAGTQLGPYEIVSAIGAGGMGEVYKARDTRLDSTVAIPGSESRGTAFVQSITDGKNIVASGRDLPQQA